MPGRANQHRHQLPRARRWPHDGQTIIGDGSIVVAHQADERLPAVEQLAAARGHGGGVDSPAAAIVRDGQQRVLGCQDRRRLIVDRPALQGEDFFGQPGRLRRGPAREQLVEVRAVRADVRRIGRQWERRVGRHSRQRGQLELGADRLKVRLLAPRRRLCPVGSQRGVLAADVGRFELPGMVQRETIFGRRLDQSPIRPHDFQLPAAFDRRTERFEQRKRPAGQRAVGGQANRLVHQFRRASWILRSIDRGRRYCTGCIRGGERLQDGRLFPRRLRKRRQYGVRSLAQQHPPENHPCN